MDLLNKIFTSVVYLSLMASAAVILISLIKLIFKNKFSGSWHYYIWLIVIIRLMLPYSINSNISLFNYTHVAIRDNLNKNISSIIEENNISHVPISPGKTSINTPETSPNNIDSQKDTLSDIAYAPSSYSFFENISYKYNLPIFWLIGITLLASYISLSYMLFKLKINSRSDSSLSDIHLILEECKKKLRVNRKVKIIYSNNINSPCILGIVKPKILIPRFLSKELDPKDIEYIILHELSHLKKNDLILNWIMTSLQVIYWFNPIIWLAFNNARKDCELSCDSFVLRKISKTAYKEYGETLLKIAASYTKYKWTPGVTSIVSKGEIKRRIIMITKFKKQSIAWSIIALSLTLLVGCGSLTNAKNNEATNNNSTITDNNSKTGDTNNSNNSNVSVPNTSDNSNNSNTNNNSPNTVNNSANSNNTSSSQGQTTTTNKSTELLKNIYALAKQGKVPDCEFASKDTLFGDVATKWGNPDKVDTVGSGKTTARYAIYNNRGFHFGMNKGDQVFDVRSFKSYLKDIKYNDVEKTLGKPAIINKTSTEHIIIYNVNKTYQLMLIFPKPTDTNKNPSLDHISVYDPADAINNMAG